MPPKIRTLLPMAADGIGPSHTCIKLADGMAGAGAPVDLLVNRVRTAPPQVPTRAILPAPLSYVPYQWVAQPASSLLETWYLSRLRAGDIAWLWPSVSLRTHDEVHRRGHPILMEGINTRMAVAKEILDHAYDAIGLPPGHGITPARIREEEAKIAGATALFAPSPGVEQALKGSPLEDRFIASSYGTAASTIPPARVQQGGPPVSFLFCGSVCVRKGAHFLLEIWPRMPKTARLRLVGRIEEALKTHYADVLNAENVDVIGFTRDVAHHYSQSDVFVFPSLEEGDPLVTYEAAAHGLPIVASAPGSGRIGAETGCTTLVRPGDADQLIEELVALHDSPDARTERGEAARSQVHAYDWGSVGTRRVAALEAMFPELRR